MPPNFPETNEALYHTLTYFKAGRIREHFRKYAGDLNLNYLNSWVDVTKRSHKEMEAEINQNIVGSIPFIQLSLFEYLRDWLNNWQFNDGFEKEIEFLIDKENEEELIRHKKEIEADELNYRSTIPPGVKYGEQYEVEIKEYYNFLSRRLVPARIENRTFLFVTDKKPDIIDKSYLRLYASIC